MRAALTFDVEHPDAPCPPGVVDAILAALARGGVRGTFFLQGRWVRSQPDEARRIVAAGHLVGNHSHHHAPMDALTDDGFRGDVREAEQIIDRVTGADPRPWFRCPFGSGMEDPRVLGLIAELGYRHVGWDVDPKDWDVRRDAATVEAAVVDGVLGREADSVVLMHGWPGVTAEALPRIVERLIDSGAELVAVDALLAD
jgi:peptidoglycan/xylan/chitin deacetylase (PgdA/CDA1 family)